MSTNAAKIAIVAGVGPGTGASVAQAFAKEGYAVALLARRTESLKPVEDSIKSAGGIAASFPTDVSDEKSVQAAFAGVAEKLPGAVEVAIFNASAGFVRKPFLELKTHDMERSLSVSSVGAFLFAQAALREMVKHKKGTLIFTGATASTKGSAQMAAFAPAKFATRALAQSLAREFGPQNIHVAHAIIDGIIDTPTTRQWMPDLFKEEGTYLDPIDIADAYVALHKQNPSCWSQEIDLRPAKEKW